MKKYITLLSSVTIIGITQFHSLYAAKGLLEGVESEEKIRRGDIHLDDIPNVLHSMINIFLGMAGTIAVIFVIIGAYKLLFGSLIQDHTKGRGTIVMALTGFAISVLAWFIVKLIFDNFG